MTKEIDEPATNMQLKLNSGYSIRWDNLFLKKRDKVITIDNDGMCLPGEVTAIINPNKKCTRDIIRFLSSNLNSDYKVLEGFLLKINENDFIKENFQYISYINDLSSFIDNLTVKEFIKLIYSTNNDFNIDIRENYKYLLIEQKDVLIKNLPTGDLFILKIVEAEILQRPIILVDQFLISTESLTFGIKQLQRIAKKISKN